MSPQAVCAAFVAAIGVTLAMASADALAAKPAPQPPPNPCAGAEARGFPALAFTKKRVTGGHVYYDTILADATGQCQQTVYVADGFAPSYPRSDVNLRYEPGTGSVLIVRSLGDTFVVSRFTVLFDVAGVPSVTSDPYPYSTLLALADLATPPEMAAWSKYVMANPRISPDGSKMLATVAFRQIQGTIETTVSTVWTCPFVAAPSPSIAATDCQMVYRGRAQGSVASAGWGGGSDALYVTDASASGDSSRSLYRLPLATGVASEIWNLGTQLYGPSGRLTEPGGAERVAVYEAGGASGCSRVWVIETNTCSSNGCTILNGAGSPARSLTWLPDGRVAGEGQTGPNRKGQCSASGSIVAFEPDDPNGTTTTTIAPAGVQPDGAGGG